jgi:hypothetical protein
MPGSGFDENGFHKPGKIGRGRHVGDPLTAEQIRDLPDGAEVVVTWCGGNGPWPYRVLVDVTGERCVENLYPDSLLPLHRVTLGWDDETRAYQESRRPEPEHIRQEWARLRGAER